MHLTTLLVMPLLTAEIAAKLIVDSDAFTHDEQEQLKAAVVRLEAKIEALLASDLRSRTDKVSSAEQDGSARTGD